MFYAILYSLKYKYMYCIFAQKYTSISLIQQFYTALLYVYSDT